MNETHETFPYLRETLVFLAVTGLLVPILRRLKVTPVLGFLAAGALIGPHGLALFADKMPFLGLITIVDTEGVRTLANLGIVFLLFTIGLELSFDRLWRMRGLVFGLGGLQVLLTAIAVGLAATAFGVESGEAIILGAAFSLSSTAMVMQLLIEEGRMATQLGRMSFALLLLQDLAVIPMLFLVNALRVGDANIGIAFALALGKAALSVVGIVILGRVVMRPLFRLVGMPWSAESFMAVTLLVILVAASATAAAGLSLALGAFLAGLLLAETEYRHQIDVDVAPFKGLLIGLFFVSVGMNIDARAAWHAWPTILGAVAGVFVLKAAIIGALGLLFREPRAVAFESAFLLGQIGEFAFVIAGVAMAGGVISPQTGEFVLIVASLTMLATPLVARIARSVARHLAETDIEHHRGTPLAAAAEMQDHVIVVGYGRVGAMLGDILAAQQVEHIAFDLDNRTVEHYRALGRHIFYADAARPQLLDRAGAARALALVVTMDNPYTAEAVVAAARRTWSKLPIYVRARDLEHADRLLELGATRAVPESFEASLQLAQETLEALGISTEAAVELCEELRARAAAKRERAA